MTRPDKPEDTATRHKACIACASEIPAAARVCAACGRSQTPAGRLGTIVKWAAGAATFVSLVIGVHGLLELLDDMANRRETVAELVLAGDRLREDGDFHRAWRLYDQAAELDPASPLVRRGREQVARDWLLNARIAKDESFTEIVDDVLPVLLTAYQRAEGADKADCLALVAFSHVLEARERPIQDVDVEDLYRQALDLEPENVLANTLLGHWLVSERRDLPAGRACFEAAVDASRGDEREFVRSFQWGAFRRIRGVSSPEDPDTVARAREYVRAAHSMVSRSETLGAESRLGSPAWMIFDAYFQFDMAHFDDVWDVLEPDQHRRVVDAVFRAIEEDHDDEELALQRRLVMARIDEAEGRREPALAAYRELERDVPLESDVRVPLDRGLTRLVGTPSESALLRSDPTAYHAERLRSAEPGSEAFEAALDHMTAMPIIGPFGLDSSQLAIESLGDARERLISADGGGTSLRALRARVVRIRAALQLRRRDLDDAIASYEELRGGDLGEVGAGSLYDLACAYSLRSARHAPGSEEHRRDRERAVETLSAAVEAGFSHWSHLKQDGDLDPIRDAPGYAGLVAGR